MRRVSLGVLIAGGLFSLAFAQDREFVLAHVGAEASFVDIKSIKKTEADFRFETLWVAKSGQPRTGGFRQMAIDCSQNEFRTLSVHKLDDAGKIGPEEPLTGQIFPVLAGNPEDGMATIVCDRKAPFPDRAPTISAATKIGRDHLARQK